jgi:hypothetical protein
LLIIFFFIIKKDHTNLKGFLLRNKGAIKVKKKIFIIIVLKKKF